LTDDRAFGADDVAGALYAGGRLRKLRFLMTDNIWRARLFANCSLQSLVVARSTPPYGWVSV
jgi:hypothetical protein